MQIRIAITAAAVAGALVVGTGARADDTRVSEGRELFGRYCASCHGMDAKGHGPASGALSPPPADLTKLSERWGTPLPKASLAEFIDGRRDVHAHGSSKMPVWGKRLTDPVPPSTSGENQAAGNIALILAYLETLQAPAQH
jgi:mono/diheme cytochrome c family protein